MVSGDGLAELFGELGVQTLDGGPTLNPSTYDLLAAIHAVPAEEVVVLPNSANVIMAAEHAAELSDKEVVVARTTSQQAGLAAAVALNPDRPVEHNAQAVKEALARVRTGAIAPAARDDAQGRFAQGEAVGFVRRRSWRGAIHRDAAAILAALAQGDGEGGEPGADQRARGRGRSARAWRDRGDRERARSSSSCATAASRPTGGCSRPSSGGRSVERRPRPLAAGRFRRVTTAGAIMIDARAGREHRRGRRRLGR